MKGKKNSCLRIEILYKNQEFKALISAKSHFIKYTTLSGTAKLRSFAKVLSMETFSYVNVNFFAGISSSWICIHSHGIYARWKSISLCCIQEINPRRLGQMAISANGYCCRFLSQKGMQSITFPKKFTGFEVEIELNWVQQYLFKSRFQKSYICYKHSMCFQPWCRQSFICFLQKISIRDIKPQNILLNRDHRLLKICDFGFSKVCYKSLKYLI